MALIKIVNKGDKLEFFIPAGYLPSTDEVIEVIISEETRNALVLKITAPRTVLIKHERQGTRTAGE
jgi:hypothetical protein